MWEDILKEASVQRHGGAREDYTNEMETEKKRETDTTQHNTNNTNN